MNQLLQTERLEYDFEHYDQSVLDVILHETNAAADRIAPYIRRTPLREVADVLPTDNARVFLKEEHRQAQSTFKTRGATNEITQLSDIELMNGVMTVSAGNHAQGVALAAKKLGVRAVTFMSRNASPFKVEEVEALGAEVIRIGETYDDAAAAAQQFGRENPELAFIHPFDSPSVITGQGTVALEIMQQQPNVDRVYIPVGGGGLLAGCAPLIKALNPEAEVIGVQLNGGDAMRQSLLLGRRIRLAAVDKFSDGTAVAEPGAITFKAAESFADRVIGVSKLSLAKAMIQHFSRTNERLEPAGALALAGLRLENPDEGTNVAICSGANITDETWSHAEQIVANHHQ